eukprot:GHVS01062116.1.p1 GENE.GHVS01062116.1~~GHVS01062116.1.p1  ORF type:complete len:135 (-),score=18.08 GHVS01062116.1:134-508(-)
MPQPPLLLEKRRLQSHIHTHIHTHAHTDKYKHMPKPAASVHRHEKHVSAHTMPQSALRQEKQPVSLRACTFCKPTCTCTYMLDLTALLPSSSLRRHLAPPRFFPPIDGRSRTRPSRTPSPLPSV